MNIHFHSSVIIAKKFSTTVSFYRDVLRQTVSDDFGACVVFSCGLSVWQPAQEHAVARHIGQGSGGAARVELCFETDGFDEVATALRDCGVSFLHDVQTESWGQFTVRFFDPEQNIVEVGESIPCFVRRLVREGNSMEQVSQRTSVSLERVKEICEGEMTP
ncbi:MAG: hypothetical protein JXX29_19960 [Deltaproteobacteria bacterium]|nr:hypothetical protein [Deltaproteobacteria bacterium]MBN2673967.1 hypothetical protein [Deltaproteobacteria bacterium]